jgi:hypothetical protein
MIAALSACTAAQDAGSDDKPVQEPAPAKVGGPMAGFARMIPGEWRMTCKSGTSMFDTWHWGPGQHSMRVMTDGANAAGEPWRELEVVYWHPGRKQVRLLGLSPFARGVSEGTITIEGETADAVFDLYQTGGRRKMGLRWTFDGPDKYHATQLEATGPDGLKRLTYRGFEALTVEALRQLRDEKDADIQELKKTMAELRRQMEKLSRDIPANP